MKRVLLVLLALVAGAYMFVPQSAEGQWGPGGWKPRVVVTAGKKYTIGLKGDFKQDGAEKKVREALEKMENVHKIAIDTEKSTATVTMTNKNNLLEETVKTALKDSGFEVTSFKDESDARKTKKEAKDF